MALTADRNSPRHLDDGSRRYGAAVAKIFGGALVMLNASGYATKGQTALALVGIGRADEQVDNTGGSAGDLNVRVSEGTFVWANSASTDLITIADIGKVCYAVDDQTVAKSSGSGTRSPAGIIVDVDSTGVHVKMGADVLSDFRKLRKTAVPLTLTTIAGAGSPAYRCIAPVSGLLTRIQSIIEAALTTADATLTVSIAGVAVTNGVLTVTQAGSAAGDKDSAVPTALNYVTAGDELKIVVTGTQASAVRANCIFEIDAD
jgi:hypothetical protein